MRCRTSRREPSLKTTPTCPLLSLLTKFATGPRYDWSAAPAPLVEHFGMGKAVAGWKAEMEALEARGREAHAAWLRVPDDR